MHRGRSWMKRGLGAGLAAGLLAASALPSFAYDRPGRTWRVSVASDGSQADVNATPPKFIPNSRGEINDTGRYVVFEGWAPNLAPDPEGGIVRPHIYRHDLVTGETVRVTVTWDGRKADNGGRGGRQSSDGRYIGFTSQSSNIMETKDTTRGTDVYVRDMETGTIDKISVAPDGSDGSNGSTINTNNARLSHLSHDGRYVVFNSNMTNLMPSPDANGTWGDLFVRDRKTNTTEMVSLSHTGEQFDDVTPNGYITGDAREVIFETTARTVVPGPVGPLNNIYVRDREANTTKYLEIGGPGVIPDGDVFLSDISRDGRFVLFDSSATNLVPYDSNAAWDSFVHDRETGRTERVSIRNDGGEADFSSASWTISPDGRYVTLESDATNLVEGDTNGRTDSFLYDRVLRATTRTSLADDGSQGNRGSHFSSITADATLVAFDSVATNLVPNDTNEEKDIFVRHLGPEIGVGELDVNVGEDSVDVTGWAGFAGRIVAGGSDPAGDATGSADIISTSVTVRPEIGSTQLRWDIDSLDPAGAPGVVYGMRFSAGGTDYEVRGMPTVPGVPRFHLFECEDACTRLQELRGRYGREGSGVVVTIPDDVVPFEPGTEIVDATMYTGLGEGLVAVVSETDSVSLGSFVLDAPQLRLGLAPRGSTEPNYGSPVALDEGRFSTTVALGGADPRTHDLWATACLGNSCSSTVRALAEGSGEELVATVLGIDLSKHKNNVRARLTLKTEDGTAIGGRELEVWLNDSPLATVTTGSDGGTVLDIARKRVKEGDQLRAVFAGDGSYLPSSATATVTNSDL